MLSLLAAAGMVVLLSGCSGLEATVLLGPRTDWQNTELAGSLTVIKKMGGRKVCGYSHSSEILAGEPFHPERTEIALDHVGCGLRWSRD